MPNTLSDFILERAIAMADHDGTPVCDLYIVAAANRIQSEITAARDELLGAPAGSAHPGAAPVDQGATADDEQPLAEDVDIGTPPSDDDEDAPSSTEQPAEDTATSAKA